MRAPSAGLRRGQVAAAADVNIETLRYYERRGLLAEPDRSPGGHRLYPADAVTVLRVIKAAQRLGFTLDEVADLLEIGRHRHGSRADAGLQPGARTSSPRSRNASPTCTPSATTCQRPSTPAATTSPTAPAPMLPPAVRRPSPAPDSRPANPLSGADDVRPSPGRRRRSGLRGVLRRPRPRPPRHRRSWRRGHRRHVRVRRAVFALVVGVASARRQSLDAPLAPQHAACAASGRHRCRDEPGRAPWPATVDRSPDRHLTPAAR